MVFSNITTKHSIAIIAAWAIIVVLCLPYALNLSKVLVYKEEAFLPENVESIIVKNIVEEKFRGKEEAEGVDLAIIVKGVDPRSKNVEETYKVFKDETIDIAEEVNSIYDILWDAQEEYDEFIQNITKELKEDIKDRLKENVSDLHEALYTLRNNTVDFEEAYLNLTDELHELHDKIYDVKEAIIDFDREYSKIYEETVNLHKLMYDLKDFILIVNDSYGEVLSNITELHATVHQIAYLITSYNNLYYNTSLLYAFTLWDTTRAHYYLLYATDAYTNPPLDSIDLETVTYYTNVSIIEPELWPVDTTLANTTYYFILSKHTFAPQLAEDKDFIDLSLEITSNIIIQQVPQDFQSQAVTWINCFAETYNTTLYSWKKQYGVNELWNSYIYIPGEHPPLTSYASQLQNLNTILYLRNESISGAVQKFTYIMAPIIASSTGLPQNVVETILYKAYEIGENPSNDSIENALVHVFEQLDVQAPFNITQLVPYLYEIGPSPPPETLHSITRDVLYQILKQYILEYGLSETTLNYIIFSVSQKYPLDADELKEETVDTVAQVIESLGGHSFSKQLLLKLYDLGTEPTLSDFREFFLETLKIPVEDEKAKPIIRTVIVRGPHIAKQPDVLRDTVITCIMRILRIENVTIEDLSWDETRNLVSKLYDLGAAPKNESLEEIAEDIIRVKLKKIADEFDVELETLEKIADEVFSRKPPLSEEEFRQITVDIIYKEFMEAIEEHEELNETFSKIDVEKFIEDVYDLGPIASTEDIENIAEKYTETIVEALVEDIMEEHPRLENIDDLPEEVVKIYVPKNDVFLILVKPLGEDAVEKYHYSLKIFEKAKAIFGKGEGIFGFSGNNEVKLYVLGPALSAGELEIYGSKDIEIIDRVSSILTLAVLVLVLASIIALFIPLINVGIALAVAFAIMYFIATRVMDVIHWARIFTIVTTLGAAIDYTTYYLLRFKDELRITGDADLAMKNTISKVTVPILISGLTTAAGFACLTFAWDFPFVRVLGLTIPIGVLAALIVSLTLTPALLKIAKGRIWLPKIKPLKEVRYSKISAKIIQYAPIVLMIASALALPMAMIALSFKGSHDYSILLPEESMTIQNIRNLRGIIDQGIFSPTTIIMEFKENVWNNESLSIVEEVCEKIEVIKGVAKVYSPTRPLGVSLEKPYNMSEMEGKGSLDFVADDNKTVMVKVILEYFPTSDEASYVVENIKKTVKAYKNPLVSRIIVGGITARIIDLDHVLTGAFKERILTAAIISMFIILAILLRSIPLALASIAIIVFNIGVAMSTTIVLFTYILKKPLIWFTHIVVFSAMLGINIDYISYFVNRVKEDLGKISLREAIVAASSNIGKSIIGLALIVVAAYGSLMLGSSWAMKEFGFVLATGVLFTGLTIPYITGPTILSVLGKKAWWPMSIREKT